MITTGPGTASLAVTANHGDISLHHVDAAPHGEIYEVWLKRGKSVTPAKARLFTVNDDGNASVKVNGSLSGVNEVLITAEPAGAPCIRRTGRSSPRRWSNRAAHPAGVIHLTAYGVYNSGYCDLQTDRRPPRWSDSTIPFTSPSSSSLS